MAFQAITSDRLTRGLPFDQAYEFEEFDMRNLIEINHPPKLLELEHGDDGHFRLVLTLQKLGVTTKLDFFLDPKEASELSFYLSKSD
jgi:hypothetical protein